MAKSVQRRHGSRRILKWVSLLYFLGANDFGGTILEENVVAAAGKEHKSARVEEIIKAVESVGRPVAQRNTRYEVW